MAVNLGIAKLRVESNGKASVVCDQYSQVPLQLHRPLYLGGADFPTVYLKSPSAGLLEGDEHRIDVSIAAHGRLEMRTQAATLVYPGSSLVHIDIKVGDEARLTYLPHVVILGKGAKLAQRVRIEVEPTSRLDFCDTWCAGRIAMQESWEFLEFDYLLEIICAGKLLYREHWILSPETKAPTHPLICGEFTHFDSHYRFCKDIENESCPQIASSSQEFEESKEWTLKRGSLVVRRKASKVSSLVLAAKS